MKKRIYEIVNKYFVRIVDDMGNLKKLNADRHLAVEAIMKEFKSILEDLRVEKEDADPDFSDGATMIEQNGYNQCAKEINSKIDKITL